MNERLQSVFRKIFHDQQLMIHEHTTASDVRGWDSLTHLELIAAVEEEFGISFSFQEVMRFENVGDMQRLIMAKISC